jgi:hypothetical protein
VLLQCVLLNITFCKLELLKLVLSKQAVDRSALGILTFSKFIPENDGRYILTAVIAAAALFSINLFYFD